MGVKVYVSGISGNKEVKKRQQRVLMILDSRNIKYDVVDIAEPGNEEQKDFMQNNSTSLGATVGDTNPRHPLPPQIFNDDNYCGDYDQFDMANEIDELEKFLKMAPADLDSIVTTNAEIKFGNGNLETKNDVKEASNEVESEKLGEVENGIENEHPVENIDEPKNVEEETNGDAKIENGNEEQEPEATDES